VTAAATDSTVRWITSPCSAARVNAVYPGVIDTPHAERQVGPAQQPGGQRHPPPAEVAERRNAGERGEPAGEGRPGQARDRG
jgi:NAD(P)-dependent dehydrogenase (short-subunit alcohol dehydrogenase family)